MLRLFWGDEFVMSKLKLCSEDYTTEQPDGVTEPTHLGPKMELNTVSRIDKSRGYGELVKDAETRLPNSLFGNAKQLPDLDASFVLVDDQAKKVVQLSDVEAAISGDTTIGQESAVLVDNVFGGFFSNHRSKEHFTQRPTTVKFDETKNFMATRISQESAQMFNLVEKSFLDNVLNIIDGVRTQNYSDTIAELKSNAKDISDRLAVFKDDSGKLDFSSKGYFKEKTYVPVAEVAITAEGLGDVSANTPEAQDSLQILQNAVVGLCAFNKSYQLDSVVCDTIPAFLASYADGCVDTCLTQVVEVTIPQLSEKTELLKSKLNEPDCKPHSCVGLVQEVYQLATKAVSVPMGVLLANRIADGLTDFLLEA